MGSVTFLRAVKSPCLKSASSLCVYTGYFWLNVAKNGLSNLKSLIGDLVISFHLRSLNQTNSVSRKQCLLMVFTWKKTFFRVSPVQFPIRLTRMTLHMYPHSHWKVDWYPQLFLTVRFNLLALESSISLE